MHYALTGQLVCYKCNDKSLRTCDRPDKQRCNPGDSCQKHIGNVML